MPAQKSTFLLKPTDFLVPYGLVYPCFCISCRPGKRRNHTLLQPLGDFMAPRIGAPITGRFSKNSSDGLLELYTPLACRRHTGRDTVTLRSIPQREIRRRRVFAFLYRCMMQPEVADAYVAQADTQTWLAVPPWNFDAHDLDAPQIIALREALESRGFPMPLDGFKINVPWMLPAAYAANKIGNFRPGINAGIDWARDYADLCSADDAREHPHPAVRKVAIRVAFEPYPLDPWPWAPRWGPALLGRHDIVNSLEGHVIPEALRRWWNFNGPMIRPGAFDPAGVAQHEAVRRQLYAAPLLSRGYPFANHVT